MRGHALSKSAFERRVLWQLKRTPECSVPKIQKRWAVRTTQELHLKVPEARGVVYVDHIGEGRVGLRAWAPH